MSVIIRKDASLVRWSLLSLLFLFGGYLTGTMAVEPGKIRLLIFTVLILCIVAFNLRHPRVVLFGLLLYLPFVTFFRRLLIPVAGWSSFDPLIVLAPITILIMGFDWVYRTYILREPIQDDTRIFRLVRYLLIIHAIQVLNPIQGGILVGFGGVMFYIVPLFWMMLSRRYFDEARMKIILCTILGIGILSALYGLKQTFYGFYDFELQWVDLAGYSALIVGTGARSFSFFTSSAEYAQYMIISIIIAWAYVLRGKLYIKVVSLVAIPVLMFGLFMIGSRGPVVFTAVGLTVMSIMNVKNAAARIVVTILALAVLAVLYIGITKINPSTNDLVAHQVNGFSNPMDDQNSTMNLHLNMLGGGLLQGIKFPIGHGLGSTTLAGAKMGDTGDNAEMDIANIMISDGVIGGIIYLVLIINVLRIAFNQNHLSTVSLAVLGILVATVTTWAFGGNYSTCTIIWLAIGFLDISMKNNRLNLIRGESK